jgi:hypothetical protein
MPTAGRWPDDRHVKHVILSFATVAIGAVL